MAASNFYLMLPSNASMKAHPENTLTDYTTNLPQRIDLSGEWECGLVTLQFPHTWYNVRKADAYFYLACETGEPGVYRTADDSPIHLQGNIPHGS